MTEWPKKIVEWNSGSTLFLSVVFSWQLPQALTRIQQPKFGETEFVVGGPAVKLNPEYLKGWATYGYDIPGMLQKHNSYATKTSVGCIRNCSFCAVPKIEGKLEELNDWPVLPIVCDNNLLACSQKHFDGVIDKLKHLEWCDFNQGLDARLLTQHHADKFAELKNPQVRLAWDNTKDERYLLSSITKLRKAGIPRRKISCYVLIGFNDTPEDALYRLETLWYSLGVAPNPMRYQPLDSEKRNEYISEHWTNKELIRYMRYWSNLKNTAGVPFSEFT